MRSERPEKQSTLVSRSALRRPSERPTQVIPVPPHTKNGLLTLIVVARIDAIQAEYSAFETLHETDDLIDTAKELNIAFIAFSPLGHGWLVDDFPFKTPDDFAPDDFRRTGTLIR